MIHADAQCLMSPGATICANLLDDGLGDLIFAIARLVCEFVFREGALSCFHLHGAAAL